MPNWNTTDDGAVRFSSHNSSERIEVDTDGIWVRADRGSGFCHESFDVFIPLHVLRHCLTLVPEPSESSSGA